ncbi:MAG: LamG-like jellyroll fold domain-containing protein [Bacteroidota bacterium]
MSWFKIFVLPLLLLAFGVLPLPMQLLGTVVSVKINDPFPITGERKPIAYGDSFLIEREAFHEVVGLNTRTQNQLACFIDGPQAEKKPIRGRANIGVTQIPTDNYTSTQWRKTRSMTSGDTLKAYYTRTNFDEYSSQISGAYADIIVQVGSVGELVFSREYSFRPIWNYSSGNELVEHLASISGDGLMAGNFDLRSRFAYARIIKNTATEVVIHWRYFPDLSDLDPTSVVHELYYIKDDGTVRREYKAGTQTIEEWLDPNNQTIQIFTLDGSGITNVQTTHGTFTPPAAISGNPVLSSPYGAPIAYWTFDEAQGNSVAPVGSLNGHSSLWKKGVSGTALGFDGYFSEVRVPENLAPSLGAAFTIDTWVVMGAYPFTEVPIVHQSEVFGQNGYFLGINEAGQAFLTVNGVQVITSASLPLNQWVHLVGAYGNGSMEIYLDGALQATENASGIPTPLNDPFLIGMNNERSSPSDPVFEPQTYPSRLGFEGLIDEVLIYNSKLSLSEINQNFTRLSDLSIKNNPDIESRVLPGQAGNSPSFGATHSRLAYHDLWDNMWRVSEFEDVTVKFDDLPTSYVYWRGTTHGVNMVTENNLWMSDQSVEIFCGDNGFPPAPSGNPSLSEHMSDKEARYSHVRVIENTPARVVMHWRYAVADVFYDQCTDANFVDEYHTIYPDGNLFRNTTFWANGEDVVSSDLQPLSSPALLPADVVNMQALSIANLNGTSADLDWSAGIPVGEDEILMANFKSNWKIYQAYTEGFSAGPWGANNQSAQSSAPFAGPWNHWPVSRIISDGRQAWDGDGRVNHFALSTGGGGSVIMYGFSNQGSNSSQDPTTVIPVVKAWRDSPPISNVSGASSEGYNLDQREYNLTRTAATISFTLAGSASTPILNPCFVIKNWNANAATPLLINGAPATNYRQGIFVDTDGTETLVLFVEIQSNASTTFEIQTDSVVSSINDPIGENPIRLYPVPTEGELFYEIPPIAEFHRLSLYDLNGRLLLIDEELTGSLSMANLPNGSYLIIFEGKKGSSHHLVQKQ